MEAMEEENKDVGSSDLSNTSITPTYWIHPAGDFLAYWELVGVWHRDCVCVCVCACMRACACVRARACACARVCVRARVRACVRACVCV